MRSPVRRAESFPFAIYALLVLMWAAWLAALLGVFRAWPILLAAVAVIAVTWRLLRPHHPDYTQAAGRKDRAIFAAALILIVAVTAMNFYFFHDTLIGTRDEGIYSNNAVYLSGHGEISRSLFEDHDIRLFANTAWNAQLYGLFSYTGLRLSNVIPFALALICIFMLVRRLSGSAWPALVSIALVAFSYPFIWYTRRTANEILFFSLFWISVFLLHRCMRAGPSFKTDLTLLMLTLPLMAFIRPEGLAVLGIGIAAAFLAFFRNRRAGCPYPAALFAVLALIMALSLFGGFMLMSDKYSISLFVQRNIGASPPTAAGDEVASKATSIYSRKSAYTTMAMIRFGLMPAILMLVPFFLLLFLSRGNRAFALFLLLLTMPFVYFYFMPNIYFDFPWFMRRYITVLIPLAMIAFSYTVFQLRETHALVIAAAFIGLTLFISWPVIFHHEYRGAVKRVEEVAALMPEDRVVLVDRYALGEYGPAASLLFVHGKRVLQVNPWSPVSFDEIGETGTVYFVTNARYWSERFAAGWSIFDDTVIVDSVEVIEEIEVVFPYLVPTCEFQRAGNLRTWTSMEWRIALSNVAVPSRVIHPAYRLLVVELEVDTAVPSAREVSLR